MHSPHPFLNQNPNPNFDERHWIIQIRRALDEEIEQEFDIPVSIFTVPKTLMLISPESYLPQQVALGPYHHWRPELHEMERYKVDAARRSQKHLKGLKFHNLVELLSEFEPKFRACYHKFLNFDGEMLAWMMAVDSCFLLEFLHIFAVKEGTFLVDTKGRRSGHNVILRDIVMLENQIPIFVLRKVMEFQLGSWDEADGMICAMLMGFCEELSPFEIVRGKANASDQVAKCAHLLDLMYHLIVPEFDGSESELTSPEVEKQDMNEVDEQLSFQKFVSTLRAGPMRVIKRLLASKPVKFIFTLPWKIVSNLPGVIMIRQFEYLCFSQEKGKGDQPENPNSFKNNIHKPPLMEEIAIPSVSDLSKAGVKFSMTNSGIFSINFDLKTATLHLPTISLDVNTEVAIRNLVAYEACNASGPLILARYTELMNGIIDTWEDARLLRVKGIVVNHLKSDEEVANLWNGMSKCIRLTKVPFLDKVIEDVNKYYNGRWKVRIGQFLGRHVFGSWQPMTFMAAVLVLFFMSLQAFCSLFGCVRLFVHHRKMN